LDYGCVETSAKGAVISDNDRERNIMLTEGGVSSSGPGLLTETICLGIAGTVAETGRRFGGGSAYSSSGG
jgi:hypothetical protein